MHKMFESLDSKRGTGSEMLANLLAAHWEYEMAEHPERATYTGHPGHNHRWTDMSFEAIEARRKALHDQLEILERIERDVLTEADRLNYDLFHRKLADAIDAAEFPGEYLLLSPMGGPHSAFAQVIAMMPLGRREHLEDALSRLRAIPAALEQSTALLRRGLEEGITQPNVVLRGTAAQIEAQVVEDPLDSPLLAQFRSDPERAGEASSVYQEDITPALLRFRDFIADVYLPGCRDSIARSALPNGEAWYEHLVRSFTTTGLTPQEIHEIGLNEVSRIRSEMDMTIAASGFQGSFAEFTQFLREDPQFFFTSAEELLTAYRDISKRADPELAPLFGTLPRLPYGVKPVPDYIAPTTTTAYYQPGAPQAGRSGYFFANTYNLPARPKWEMEALTLHEAVPGHHLQIALAQEIEELPEFRRHGFFTAFVEGWGLYSESLGTEMGFYGDSYSRFGQLTYEMWRAIRLVVDTGMHALGWTREQAIEYFKEHTGKTEHDIVVEVDRYIAWPGQALAYKIGELKIKELRRHAESELGNGFDIRTFHDTVLLEGALPLDVLEERVRAWVRK